MIAVVWITDPSWMFDAGADGDRAVVAPEHGVGPDRRLRPDPHVADDRRVGVDVGGRVDVGNLVSQRVDGHELTLQAKPQAADT